MESAQSAQSLSKDLLDIIIFFSFCFSYELVEGAPGPLRSSSISCRFRSSFLTVVPADLLFIADRISHGARGHVSGPIARRLDACTFLRFGSIIRMLGRRDVSNYPP